MLDAAGMAQPAPPTGATIPLLKSCETRYKRRIASCSGGSQIAPSHDNEDTEQVEEHTEHDLDPVDSDLQPMPGRHAAGVDTAGKSANEEFLGVKSVDENIPLAALFGSAPINESDILPPSILQSMNFWLNDSMLTGNAGMLPGTGTFASQMGLMNNNSASSAQPAPAASAAAAIQFPASQGLQQQQQQPQGLGLLSNLIPMDFALGLPALSGNMDPAVSMALTRAPTDSFVGFGTLGTLPQAGRPLGVSTDFLQQLSQQIMPFDDSAKSSANSPYSLGASILSPLTAASPNLLGHSDMPNSMAHFPTSAFASLNLVNALDLQHSAQISQQLQATTSAGADISALLSSSVLSQMPTGINTDPTGFAGVGVGSSAGCMRPVPNALLVG
ncbi:hypothetical protein GGI01_003796 [Coemansia sp. RSA 376]|nr:hypothetical protein GGI01_003796 [Coemansia sp. RSA 376]